MRESRLLSWVGWVLLVIGVVWINWATLLGNEIGAGWWYLGMGGLIIWSRQNAQQRREIKHLREELAKMRCEFAGPTT
ncbi:MAG: hypothetical protein KDA63_16340 [Planctomycetales bacterium]|nr:hypothetical protein [Planctomycetales bacterium]